MGHTDRFEYVGECSNDKAEETLTEFTRQLRCSPIMRRGSRVIIEAVEHGVGPGEA
jgi:hypothetical protein